MTTTTTTRTMGQQNTKSYMVYVVGGRKDVKKLFGGSHVLEFGFGVQFLYLFCFVCFLLLGVLSIVGFGFVWDSDHSTLSKSKFKRFQSVAIGMQLKRKFQKKKNAKKKSNEAYKIFQKYMGQKSK